MTFMPFIVLQTFKVKLFEKTHCGAIYLQTEVTLKNSHSCIFFSMILNLIFLVLEVVYAIIGNPACLLFNCLAFYLTGIYFRGKLQYTGLVCEQ